jgi:L-aminopeptidase/D-esterase-like protein
MKNVGPDFLRVEEIPLRPVSIRKTQGIAMLTRQKRAELDDDFMVALSGGPNKALQQLLTENLQQKDGLAQLAAAVREAILWSGGQYPSQQPSSTTGR